MKKYILIYFILFSLKTFACLNGETKVLKNGAFIYEDQKGIYPYGHRFHVKNFEKLISELDSLYSKTKDLEYLSDKGYVLVIQKKYTDALKIYLNIEKIKPNRYSTASNIGTIYELIGENQKAFEWIKKVIKINSKSHNESEWLHLNILEAKLKGENYINSDFLIKTNFGNDTIPKTKLNKNELVKLSKALYYQLNERVTFIKPKEKIIALLLFELGNIAYLQGSISYSKLLYKKAIEYGYTEQVIFSRLELCYIAIIKIKAEENNKQFEKIRVLNTQRRMFFGKNSYWILIVVSVIITQLILIISLYIKFKRKIK